MPVRYDWLDGELLRLPGVTKDLKLEWNWTRYMVGGKLFCAVCHDDAGRDACGHRWGYNRCYSGEKRENA